MNFLKVSPAALEERTQDPLISIYFLSLYLHTAEPQPLTKNTLFSA
jgi:hypothetical protein